MPLTPNFTGRAVYPVTTSGNPGKNRDIHGEAVKFFDSIASWQRIASQSGSAGSGLGTSGDPDSSGEEAWATWTALSSSTPFDLVMKWSWSSFYSTNQLEIAAANYGVGIGVAMHSSSQAWNGTTSNDLADTFPNGTPWKSGSLVFPRQNEKDGIHETEGDREYVAPLSIDPPGTGGRMLCVGDDDWFFIHISQSNTVDNRFFYFGPYIPITTSYGGDRPFNYVMLSSEQGAGFGLGIDFTSVGEANDLNGGVTIFTSGSSVTNGLPRMFGFKLGTISSSFSEELKVFPSSSGVGPVNELPLIIYSTETDESPITALGYLEHIRAVNSDLNNYDYLETASRLVLSGFTTMNGYAQTTIPYPSSLTGSLPEGIVRSLDTTFLTSSLFPTTVEGGTTLTPIYRGENPPGTFVYSEGSPPVGATNVVLLGFK